MLECECYLCRLKRDLEASPTRHAMIVYYIKRFHMSEPEARAALEREDSRMWDKAMTLLAERDGLGESAAGLHILTHGFDMPAVWQ